MQKIKKNSIIWLIFGIITFLISAYSLFNLIKDGNPSIDLPWGEGTKLEIVSLASGILILLFAFYFIYPNTKSNNRKFKNIYIFELLLILAVSMVGFITPFVSGLFTTPVRLIGVTELSLWYGLIIYTHGVIKVGEYPSLKGKAKNNWYFLGIIMITFGTFLVLERQSIETMFVNVLIGMLLAISLVIVYITTNHLTKKRKLKKKQTNSEEAQKLEASVSDEQEQIDKE